MSEAELSKVKFPIGPFVAPESVSRENVKDFIATITAAPAKYRVIATGLSSADLAKTYRPGSWNIRQLIHHVADMQLLHFFRMKKALTEKDYKEVTLVNMDGWASTADGTVAPIEDSLALFESITKRFVILVDSLTEDQLDISYYHPVRKIMLNQKQAVSMSAWHVKHHLEHIKIALSSNS
jgi:hypothetical protein